MTACWDCEKVAPSRCAAHMPKVTPDLDALTALHEAATEAVPRPLTLNRYEHGGGRWFAGKQLVADFYDEANRELFAAVEAQLPSLIEAARREAGLREALSTYVNSQVCACNDEPYCPDRPFREQARALLHDSAGAATPAESNR